MDYIISDNIPSKISSNLFVILLSVKFQQNSSLLTKDVIFMVAQKTLKKMNSNIMFFFLQNILNPLLKNLKLETVLFCSTRGVLGWGDLARSLSFLDEGGDGEIVFSSLINNGFRGTCLLASRRISRTVS